MCTVALVSSAPDHGWCPIDSDCSTPTSDGLGELPECRGILWRRHGFLSPNSHQPGGALKPRKHKNPCVNRGFRVVGWSGRRDSKPRFRFRDSARKRGKKPVFIGLNACSSSCVRTQKRASFCRKTQKFCHQLSSISPGLIVRFGASLADGTR